MDYLPAHIRQLLTGYALGELGSEQQQELRFWMEGHPEHQCLLEAAMNKERLAADLNHLTDDDLWKLSFKDFEKKYLPKNRPVWHLTIRRGYWAAAVILLLIMVGLKMFQDFAGFKNVPDKSIVSAQAFAEVLLSNGSKIQLGKVQGAIGGGSQGAGTTVQLVDTGWYHKLTEGMAGKDSAAQMAALSFSIVTPKGGKYALALPDGSKVWMGAASRLSYHQHAGVRQVDMEGEIYFEIAKQAYQKNGKTLWRPFKVQAKDMAVEVWGTKFTVHAYPNNPVETTTLFEGKVKVSTADQTLFLSPGQSADLKAGLLSKQNVDNSQGAALKEGYFMFRAEKLADILSEIGNWYNVNIVFKDDQIGQERFEAMLPRTSKLADLLDAIESTGNISFKFKDRTIYVDKK